MAEREHIRVPVDELAPESIPHVPQHDEGTIVTISPRNFDRLNAFRTILRNVFDSEEHERQQGRSALMGELENGKVVKPYMKLDSRFRATMNEKASHLYEAELMHDPALKDVADDIVAELKAEYDGPPALTVQECVVLFER